jgi:PAS domain-containing protein
MIHHAWVEEFPGAITVCNTEGVILAMNDQAAKIYEQDGGQALVGSNLLDCHPESVHDKVKRLLETREPNVYTLEKNGVKKMVYQSPWYRDGQHAGLIELEFEIPFQMRHFIRGS